MLQAATLGGAAFGGLCGATGGGDVTQPLSGKERTRAWRERRRAAKVEAEAAIQAEIAVPPQEPLPGLPARSEAGRPEGSGDRDPAAWRRYALGRWGTPLKVLAETYSASDADLVAVLRCSLKEARDLRLKAAAEALPYLHRKMPNDVVLDAGGAPLVVAIAPSLAAALDAEDRKQNQRVVDVEAG